MFSIANTCSRTAQRALKRPPTLTSLRMIHVEKRLEELDIILPVPVSPRANYNIVCHASGNMLYISGKQSRIIWEMGQFMFMFVGVTFHVSFLTATTNHDGLYQYLLVGHLPFKSDGTLMTGRIGEDGRDKAYGYEAARTAGLNIISTLKEHLGDLDRVEQVVKVFGIVQSTNDFKEQHLVMDGCSDLIMEVFGKPVGYHARSAIGTNTLPVDISVEVEAVVQIKLE